MNWRAINPTLAAYFGDRGQRSILVADSFSHALGPLPSMF